MNLVFAVLIMIVSKANSLCTETNIFVDWW